MKDVQPTPLKDQKALVRSLRSSADECRAQGKYAEAEPLYRRALVLAETVFGPDHLEVSAVLNNLAVLCKADGNYAEAEVLYQRSLAVFEQALGPQHPK